MSSRRPIRIACLITRLNVGGPARHVVWLTEAMTDGEFETTLITGSVPPGEDDMSHFAAEHGVVPVVFPRMSREIAPSDVVTIWQMFRYFRKLRPDVVHTHTAKAGAVGRLAGVLYRMTGHDCRLIHTYHGHVFHSYYGALKTRIFLAVERTLARFTDRIIVVSPQQLSEIHGTFRIGQEKQFRMVPYGIDLQAVRGDESHRKKLRAQLGVADDQTLVGIVGRLAPIKNHELFLRAATHFDPRVQFAIFGDGSERAALERRVDELQLRDGVHFAGVHDAAEIFSATDIIALTSRNEGAPFALIEAMANGIPIVSTAVGGVVDLLGSVIEQGSVYDVRERGVTIASFDDAAFASALQRVISDPSLRQVFSRNAKEFAQNYSKDRLIADIIQLTRELID